MPFRKGQAKVAGRVKGTPNRRTKAKAAKIAESGLTPLEYMLGVLRDPTARAADRMDAAKGAAPYCHPRLTAVEMTGKGGGPIEVKKIEWNVVDPAAKDSAGVPAAS